MNWLLYELVHQGGDGGVEDEGDEEEEPENADDGQGPEEQGGVVLDLVHAGGRLLGLTHGGVNLRHDDALLDFNLVAKYLQGRKD